MTEAKQVQATRSFHFEGRTVGQGERLEASDPLVAAQPELFGPASRPDDVVAIDSFFSAGRSIRAGDRLSPEDELSRLHPQLFYPAGASEVAARAAIAAYRDLVRGPAPVALARMVRALGRRGKQA